MVGEKGQWVLNWLLPGEPEVAVTVSAAEPRVCTAVQRTRH